MVFIYRKYRIEDKNQVVDLLQHLWDYDASKRLRYFEWKFEQNPYTIDPLAYVAVDGDKVVAFRGYMVIPVQIDNRDYLCAVLADTVTHPDYQRKGLFSGVTNYSIKEILKDERYLISLNSSSGGKTLKGYTKLEWVPFCEREHLFRFTWKGIINKIISISVPELQQETSSDEGKYLLSDTCDALSISSMPFKYTRLSHKRDYNLYKWRFYNPNATYKFAYSYDQSGELRSYLILFKISDDKWDLIDFNTIDSKDLKALFKWTCRHLQPLFILLWTVSKTNIIYQSYSKFGFIPLNRILRLFKKFQKPPFLVREFNTLEHKIMDDPSKWDLYKLVADEI